MSDNDFYVDDELIEDVKAAMKRGVPGMTIGTRRLSRKQQRIIDRHTRRQMGMGRREYKRFVDDCFNSPPWDGTFPRTGSNNSTIYETIVWR